MMYVWFLCRYLSNDSTSIMAYGFTRKSVSNDFLVVAILSVLVVIIT
jgi:hypothetical protein